MQVFAAAFVYCPLPSPPSATTQPRSRVSLAVAGSERSSHVYSSPPSGNPRSRHCAWQGGVPLPRALPALVLDLHALGSTCATCPPRAPPTAPLEFAFP